VLVFFHNTWIGPVKILVGLYYLDVVLGKSVIVGFLILFLFIFLQGLWFLMVQLNYKICFSLYG
jgi:hypothetical protein